MGARGVGDSHAGGLGSVAEAVLARSPVPVTVVRAAPAERQAGSGDIDDSASTESGADAGEAAAA